MEHKDGGLFVALDQETRLNIIAGVAAGKTAKDAQALHGDVGREVGDLHEHKTLGLVRRAIMSLSWVQSARRSTADEDAQGKDIIVITADIGEIYIQVKSSKASAANWKRKHSSRFGARAFCVVYDPKRPPSPSSLAKMLRASRLAIMALPGAEAAC